MLTSSEIMEQLALGRLTIEPFSAGQLNPNSYNVRLAPVLFRITDPILDLKRPFRYEEIEIPAEGYMLEPGQAYLGVTVERTYTPCHIPVYEGRSTLARYFVSSHCTAGYGDLGFDGNWTLELTCAKRILIYPYTQIGQIAFYQPVGAISKRYGGRYSRQTRPCLPVAGNI